jgi:Uma2 family endonuclease
MKSRISETKPEAATKDLYTYGDYAKWPDEERWELIDGVPYNMSPAPSRTHQRILGDLHRQIANYLIGKTCEVYIAPFDVRLPKGNEKDEQIDTVVQPDLVVVCDREKLDERGCKGAPDLVIEVLSPYTAGKDMKIKLALYERVGVREYWIVDPVNKTVQVYQLEIEGRYGRPGIYTDIDHIKVGLFPDLEIELSSVFRE